MPKTSNIQVQLCILKVANDICDNYGAATLEQIKYAVNKQFFLLTVGDDYVISTLAQTDKFFIEKLSSVHIHITKREESI